MCDCQNPDNIYVCIGCVCLICYVNFPKKKNQTDYLIIDQLDTTKLNAHLKERMSSHTTKVFRTITLDEKVNKELRDGIFLII